MATAPFCSSEVVGCVRIPESYPLWKKLLRFMGPGLLMGGLRTSVPVDLVAWALIAVISAANAWLVAQVF